MSSPLQIGLFEKQLAPPPIERVLLSRIDVVDAPPPSDDLVRSIRLRKVIVPVVLISAGAGRYSVREGRRRILALRMLGETDVEARVWSPAHAELLDVTALELHESRTDNPVATYRVLKHLQTTHGLDAKGLAHALHMPLARVVKLLALDALDESCIQAFVAGKVSLTVAEDLAKLPDGARRALTDKLRRTGRLERADIAAAKASKAAAAASALPQGLLSELFGQPVKIGAPTLHDIANALSVATLQQVVADLAASAGLEQPCAIFADALRRKALVQSVDQLPLALVALRA